MMSKYKTLIIDFFVFAFGSVGSKIVVFFLVPFYTNILSAEEYGIADLVFTFTELLMPLACVTIYDAILRFGLENKKNPENTMLCGILVWAAGCGITLVLLPLLGLYQPIAPWKWYIYAHVNASILLSISLNYLKVKNKNLRYSLISILQTATLAGLNILLLAVFKIGVKGYLLSNTIAAIVAAVSAFLAGNVIGDLKSAKFDKTLLRNMVIYSAPLILNSVSWWVIHSSNKIMIEFFAGAAALGLFTVASRIPSLINVFVTIFQQSWGISSITEMDSTNDSSFYETVFQCYTICVLFACLMLNTIIKPFMGIYVAEEFFSSWTMVPLLVVSAAAFSSIAAFFGSLYGALKKSVNNMLTTLASAVTNLVVGYFLISKIGAMGAVISTLIAYGVLAISRMLDVGRYVKFRVGYMNYAVNCLILIVHAIAVMMDFYIVPASIIAVIVFLLYNRRYMMDILLKFKQMISK